MSLITQLRIFKWIKKKIIKKLQQNKTDLGGILN